jgi:hypothetical protein
MIWLKKHYASETRVVLFFVFCCFWFCFGNGKLEFHLSFYYGFESVPWLLFFVFLLLLLFSFMRKYCPFWNYLSEKWLTVFKMVFWLQFCRVGFSFGILISLYFNTKYYFIIKYCGNIHQKMVLKTIKIHKNMKGSTNI